MFKVTDMIKKGDKVILTADDCKCKSDKFCNGDLIVVELNPCCFKEEMCKIVGTEDVEIEINGCKYPLLTNAGNVFHGGRIVKKHKYEYRLVFGDDGYPKNIEHWECVNSPKCCHFSPKKGSNKEAEPVIEVK